MACFFTGLAQTSAKKNNDSKSDTASGDAPLILVMTTDEGNVEVSWVSPASDAVFTIQRSGDGAMFYDLYKISNVSKNMNGFFSVKDNSPLKGTSYYRIKQSLPNNSFVYSGIDKIVISSPGNINISKNYRTGNYLVDFIANTPGDYLFEITAAGVGQPVFSQKLDAFSGTFSKEVDLNAFGKNIYFIRVEGKEQKISKKVVVY